MQFLRTRLEGAYIIELDELHDERGFFARTFCQEEFKKYGLNPNVVQCNISYNKKKGTLRGMHFQVSPYPEAKLVSCIKGSIYDVIIDLRKDSKTYCQWFGMELPSVKHTALYIPEGFAHGFQTLEDHTTVFYQMSELYHPECSQGFRWNDPAFGIVWPQMQDIIISEKDSGLPWWECCHE